MRKSVPPVSDPSRLSRSASRFRLPQKFFAGSVGFTLLEVMIAMAILAITLVTVYQSQSQSISMVSNSRFLTSASLLAQARMAEIDAADPSELVSASGDFGEEFSDYTWQVEVGAVKEIPLLKRIALTVTNGRMTTHNTYRLILYKVVLP
jgi:general secretion pathway protein I